MGWPIFRKWGFEITFPDLVTCLNLCAGVLAIYTAVEGELITAMALIVVGMAFDYVDGKFARAYFQAHPFGKELDSFADLVTFGLAPGVIALSVHDTTAVLVTACVYGVASAFRLVRFNLSKKREYKGMPVPVAAAVLLVGVVAGLTGVWLAVVMLLTSVLMLSTIPFPKV